MNGIAREILVYLAAQSLGSLTAPITLFENAMPPAPDICGAVFDTPGSAPDLGFGVQGVKYENPSVQVRFRGIAFDDDGPRQQAQLAFRALAKIQAMTLSGTPYLMVRPIGSPGILERDSSNRVVWSFNAQIEKEPS